MDNPVEHKSERLYDRWDIHQRIQHWFMVLSFTLLTVTGLMMHFAYTGWVQKAAQIFGSFENLFLVHLTAAVLMMINAFYHLIYLIVLAFQGKLRGSMLPRIQDAKDIIANLRLFLGFAKEGPRFSKYSYKEKVDYLAEYWGTPVMIVTGLILWFPHVAANIFPRQVIDSAHVIHQGEALLAILVIFIWHIYSVHFTPGFFPMNQVWLTGRLSREVMEEEYPLELARLEEEEKDHER
ncbi:cytochrome b/b6 domain-containing protein [Dehalobacterium formicoaceticum]|uniref:formate dehydrogenase subunit gamma n=1 Tax=Dehalobacterium formicoaceticum TaxID=51515 RepID=UPI0031F6E12C